MRWPAPQLGSFCHGEEDEDEEEEEAEDGTVVRAAARKAPWIGGGVGTAETQSGRTLRKGQGAHERIACHDEVSLSEVGLRKEVPPMWEL